MHFNHSYIDPSASSYYLSKYALAVYTYCHRDKPVKSIVRLDKELEHICKLTYDVVNII